MKVDDQYDAIVIGAGPAGALAAKQLGSRGYSVLLVEKSIFPRHKVCGCCLNSAALQTLTLTGLSDIPDKLGAVPLDHFCIASGRRQLHLPLQEGRALSRKNLDNALVAAAVESGVTFLASTNARVRKLGHDLVEVVLSENHVARSRIVIAADGLGGTSLQSLDQFAPKLRAGSRIGAGVVSMDALPFYQPGTIFMTYGKGGYLGLVKIEDGQVDIAAAFDSAFLKEMGSPAKACQRLLQDCDWPIPKDILDVRWQGTSPLTRRRKAIAGHRLFVIGDAASYVEPFTGEGIAWAMASALAVIPLAESGLHCFDDRLISQWHCTYNKLMHRRQTLTKVIAEILRHKDIALPVWDVLNTMPGVPAFISRAITAPWAKEELEWLRS